MFFFYRPENIRIRQELPQSCRQLDTMLYSALPDDSERSGFRHSQSDRLRRLSAADWSVGPVRSVRAASATGFLPAQSLLKLACATGPRLARPLGWNKLRSCPTAVPELQWPTGGALGHAVSVLLAVSRSDRDSGNGSSQPSSCPSSSIVLSSAPAACCCWAGSCWMRTLLIYHHYNIIT